MESVKPLPVPFLPEVIRPYFQLEFGCESVSLMLHLIYLCIYRFTHLITQKTSSFFTLFNIVCISGALRSFYWISVILYNHFNTEEVPSMGRNLVLQFSLFVDIWEDQFWQCMIFLITLNSLLSQRKTYSFNVFRKHCGILLVVVSVLGCSFASLLFIRDSQIIRIYNREFGVIDAGTDSHIILVINRFFYTFTIGSVICCVLNFFSVIRQHKNKTSPIGTSFVRENGIFVPLVITLLLNSLCCLGVECIDHAKFEGNETRKIVWVRVLSSADTLTKLSLPIMIVVSNCFYHQKEDDQKSVDLEME